jgi:phage major head subunit gpT-like protein
MVATEPTTRVVDMPSLSFRADIVPSSIDKEDRTVDVIWSTGSEVERYEWWSDERYIEKLSMKPEHIRLERLNLGAALLDTHSSWSVSDMLGAVVPGSASVSGGKGRAKVKFSRRDDVEGYWQDVLDGILRFLSVGYRIHQYEESEAKGNKLPIRLATDWEPHELSMVPIPADAGAATRGGKKPADTNRCEIVTRAVAPSEAPKERVMENEQADPQFLVEDPAPVPAVRQAPVAEEPNDRDRGAAAERARVQGIMLACRSARLPLEFQDGLIKEGLSLVDAQARVFAAMRERAREDEGPSPVPSGSPRIEVGDDPLVHSRAGIVNAVLNRVAPNAFKLEAVGQNYRGMTLLDIGRAFLHAKGIRTTGMDRMKLAQMMLYRTGMHSTSDFPSLLEDVAHKTLRAAYDEAPHTWRPLAKLVQSNDFKPARQLQVGDAPRLDEILEHGEFTSGTIAEGKETTQLKTYGKTFAITRQAIINDDLSAFADIPAAFGRAARNTESDLAWAQITSNPTMGDGNSLFDATNHKNYTSSGTAIAVDSIGVGRALLRRQKGIDGETILNLAAKYLIVPATKETLADKFVSTNLLADAAGNINPFSGRLSVIAEPRLDEASELSWYLACAPESAPVLYYVVLAGNEGPQVSQQEGFDIDGVKYRCRLDVGFKAADWRAIYKNAGA